MKFPKWNKEANIFRRFWLLSIAFTLALVLIILTLGIVELRDFSAVLLSFEIFEGSKSNITLLREYSDRAERYMFFAAGFYLIGMTLMIWDLQKRLKSQVEELRQSLVALAARERLPQRKGPFPGLLSEELRALEHELRRK